MNYDEIIDLALSYADRTDEEVTSRMDKFLRIVEARINRILKVSKMSTRASLDIIPDLEYYGLPTDFGGFRDVEVQTVGGERKTLHYQNPEQMNNRINNGFVGTTKIYYTLVARQLQIVPPQQDGSIEIIYYQNVVPLTPDFSNNWLGDTSPDCYVWGLLVEISSFAKDKESVLLWDIRFKEVMAEIDDEDGRSRWSGTPLVISVG